MDNLDQRLAKLPPEQRALLERALLRKGGGGAPSGIPRRFEGGAPAPLSFPQQRLWFLHQLDPASPHYNIPLLYRLGGAVDADRLESTLQALVRRHEPLRTRFALEQGEPVQVVEEALLRLERIDLTGEVDQESAGQQKAAELVQLPFDLGRGPVIRAALLKVAPEVHLLLLVIHHIAMDGWSASILLRELVALYIGEETGLPSLPIQYRDYSVWQRDALQGPEMEQQLHYWRQQLGDGEALLELPTDRPRPAIFSHKGAKVTFTLERDLTDGLKRLSREEGATLFITLLAGFKALLHRYARQEQVTVGTPIANRSRPETEGLVGYFANTLALRTDLVGNPTFRELLARVREVALGAYAHQDLPFERLVEELQPGRNQSHQPIFQVLFTLQTAGAQPPAIPGVTVEPVVIDAGTALFDLTLSLEERGDQLHAVLQYSTDLFDEATIQRMVGHYRQLLNGAVAQPDRHVTDLPLLTEGERQQLLVEWNRTDRPYDIDQPIFQAFETLARQRPEAIALVYGHERITYGELNRRANQLAHHLREMGVGRESLVGICLERTPAMVVGLLGILKAGGAYVPLDPAYPRERLGFILEDAACSVLLTQQSLLPLLPEQPSAKVLLLDQEWPVVAEAPNADPGLPIRGGDLAYVIYTSGSTGRPKGVPIEHGSAVTLLCWAEELYSPDERAALLAATSICFDLSVYELFFPLSTGGRIILAENALALPDLPAAGEVTLINTVPSAAAELLRIGGIPQSVVTVNLAGEPLPHWLAEQIYGLEHVQKLYNLYGPSEDTTYSTWALVERGSKRPPTIGRPIANTQVYLLDAQMEPVPVGVPGELYLGGAGLARGYLARPELTAERFLPNPFQPGARLYRTGDLARYLPDGQIEYLGRIDHQVKIRGFRIELGEIETLLSRHPGVRETVLLAREDQAGEKRLVAYLVPAESGVEVAALKAYLAEQLPEYMIPSTFVLLERLPLTPNGKVDRKALPAPEEGAVDQPLTGRAPEGPVEEALAAIWCDLLRLRQVSAEVSFFEVGGHSLLATRLIARIQERFGVALPLRAFFGAPTVAALAQLISTEQKPQGRTSKQQAVALKPRDPARPAPLSYAQQRLWFLCQLDPSSPFYNLSETYRLEGPLDPLALQEALAYLVQRHEALRTSIGTGPDGEPVQVVAPELRIRLAQVDLTSLPPEQRRGAAEARLKAVMVAPFDLARGPLFRAMLLRLGEREHLLHLGMHHIISDGWSLGVLMRELAKAYDAALIGLTPELPPLPIQFADYACWQREHLEGRELERQLAWWREAVGINPEPLEMPADHPRPPVQSHRGADLRFEIGPEATRGLKELAQSEGATLFMALLAGYFAMLHRHSGQPVITVGSPIANRQATELEGLIGCFTNTLLFKADMSGNPTFRELLRRVREFALGAFDHQDLPFERLVQELAPERDMSRSPLFQAFFVLQNMELAPPAMSGLSASRFTLPDGTAKFDLYLALTERQGTVQGLLQYSLDLFEAESAERMTRRLVTLLTSAAREPEVPISDLSLLDEEEREAVLHRFNQTEAAYPGDLPVHRLIEAQAAANPERVAARFGAEAITYGQLNRRANQLAHHLRTLGVGPERLVGIYMERSLEMLVSLLAVWKAGGAYLPLDPTYPLDRLRFMAEDAGITVLLGDEQAAEGLSIEDLPVLLPAQLSPGLPEDNLPVAVGAEALAYVLYTSGSTGKPKGVPIEHRSLVNFLFSMGREPGLTQADRLLSVTSISFDIAGLELWLPLITGAEVIIASRDVAGDGQALARLIQSTGTTLMQATPATYRLLLGAGWQNPTRIRMLVGGEALPRELAGALLATGGQLWNLYGPTETTIWSTVKQVTAADGPISIGRPIANTQVYILSAEGQLQPIGVPGELFIGGDGVARGYFGRPELTAERFLPNPFRSSGRIYRTGDLARWRTNGELEFLGRTDHQVKIRGYRIELGEIEAALASHPAVKQAVVVAREERLVAYLMAAGSPPSADQLRVYLEDRLPAYMIPSAFVMLEQIPLTPNGKVDRKALPTPQTVSESVEYAAPATDLERQIAALWQELLRVEAVGADQNFFALGGDSLMGARLVTRLRELFPVEVPLRILFESPTVAKMAQAVEHLLVAKLEALSDEEALQLGRGGDL